jgi:hypothetical protein
MRYADWSPFSGTSIPLSRMRIEHKLDPYDEMNLCVGTREWPLPLEKPTTSVRSERVDRADTYAHPWSAIGEPHPSFYVHNALPMGMDIGHCMIEEDPRPAIMREARSRREKTDHHTSKFERLYSRMCVIVMLLAGDLDAPTLSLCIEELNEVLIQLDKHEEWLLRHHVGYVGSVKLKAEAPGVQ